MTDNIANKKLFVFDLDGTLTQSKTVIDDEMVDFLAELLAKRKVAVIGGGWFPQFKKQFLINLDIPEVLLKNLSLFPTSGTRFYEYQNGWQEVYAHDFSEEDRKRILDAFKKAFEELKIVHPDKIYGELIQDRGSQITYSVFGQETPLEIKEAYFGSKDDKRLEIANLMKKYIPDFEIRIAGKTSIDVTMKGVDKGYGVEQMSRHLNIPISDMIFVGDALYEGGNDEAVKRTGIENIQIESAEDTKDLLRKWIPQL